MLNKTHSSKIDTDIKLDVWYVKEDKDVMLISDEDIKLTTRKQILEGYLKSVSEKLIKHNEVERIRTKLKSRYRVLVDNALKDDDKYKKMKEELSKHPLSINDKKFIQEDSSGDLYVSNDL
ncbi:MAG: hypothetical protein KBB52_02340 [Candidatus Omnitrophica bacterium]|nr:hypothetical protein [Candidatus Omnitrophota bacterium]